MFPNISTMSYGNAMISDSKDVIVQGKKLRNLKHNKLGSVKEKEEEKYTTQEVFNVNQSKHFSFGTISSLLSFVN